MGSGAQCVWLRRATPRQRGGHQNQAQQRPPSSTHDAKQPTPNHQDELPKRAIAERDAPSRRRREAKPKEPPRKRLGTEPRHDSDHAQAEGAAESRAPTAAAVGNARLRRTRAAKATQSVDGREAAQQSGPLQRNRDSGLFSKIVGKRRGECRGARAHGPLCPRAGSADDHHAKRGSPREQTRQRS